MGPYNLLWKVTMRLRPLLFSAVLIAALTGCTDDTNSEDSQPTPPVEATSSPATDSTPEPEPTATATATVPTMPDLVGRKLDDAYEDLADIGYDDKDDVQLDGGGMFGVVVESNWTICAQEPAPGGPITDDPKLTIDRSCDTDDETEDADEEPANEEVVTTANNPEFAALLKNTKPCSAPVAKFAKEYAGRIIEFDGTIWDVAPHGDYNTRFDFLIGAGDFDPNKGSGPNFQFQDHNASYDLNLSRGPNGPKVPNSIRVGQNYTFLAEVLEYSDRTCLFQLDAIETRTR